MLLKRTGDDHPGKMEGHLALNTGLKGWGSVFSTKAAVANFAQWLAVHIVQEYWPGIICSLPRAFFYGATVPPYGRTSEPHRAWEKVSSNMLPLEGFGIQRDGRGYTLSMGRWWLLCYSVA